METTTISPEFLHQNKFRSYLRGMETANQMIPEFCIPAFRSYLRGMETHESWNYSRPEKRIPILPMRHGNALRPANILEKFGIPILPTRRGNQVEEFYSYLISLSQPPHALLRGGGEKIEAHHGNILAKTFPTENCKDLGISLASTRYIQPECMDF